MAGAESALSPRAARWKPPLAALLSALIPGAGQWYGGRRRRAVLLFAPALGIVIAGITTGAVMGTTDIIGLAVRPSTLWALIGGNVLVVAWRLFAVADAYLLMAAPIDRTAASWALLAGLLILVAVPHAVAGSYGLQSIDLLESVFVAEADPTAPPPTVLSAELLPPDGAAADPVTIARPIVGATTVEYRTVSLIFQEGIGDPDAIAVRSLLGAEAATAPPFLPFDERVDDNRLTILLSGGDAGPGRSGLRTDTMIVATVNMDTDRAALFGIPRNLKRIPLPHHLEDAFVDMEREIWESWPDEDGDGFPDNWIDLDGDDIPDEPEFESCECFPEILNSFRGRTQHWTRSYPGSSDPGMDALADLLGHLLGLHIDYWMLVDMSGFVRLIDAMGGVDVMITEPMHVGVSATEEGLPKAVINVEPGLNHLSGGEALAWVRWRIGSSDYARMQRQRCLLRAVAAQADPLGMLRSFSSITTALDESVKTNIPLSFLPDLVEVVGRIDLNAVATVGFVPSTYNDGRTPGGYPIPDVERIRRKVDRVLTESEPTQNTPGESECGA